MALGITRDKVQISVEIDGKEVKNTINDLNKAYRQLNREIKDLTPGTEKFNKKAAELSKVKEQLGAARDAARGFNQNLGPLQKGFKALGGVIKTSLSALLPLLAIGEIINAARAVFDLEKQFNDLRASLNRLSGESGEALSGIAVEVKALSDTFEVEQQQIIDAGQAAAEEFGVGYQEAFATIGKGLLTVGGAGAEELLAQVDEYAVQFKQAGFDLEESVAIIAQGINQGVFTDKAADAVKEFGLRIQDLSKAQEEVLADNFGQAYVDKLKKGLGDGSVEVKDVLSDVSQRVADLDAQGKNTQPLIANIFGGAGEDAGVAFIASLANVDQGLADVTNSTNLYDQQQAEALETNRDLAAAQEAFTARIEGSSGQLSIYVNQFKSFVFEILVNFVDFITTLPQRIDVLGVRIKLFGAEATNAFLGILDNAVGPFLDAINTITGTDLQIGKVDTAGLEAELLTSQQSIQDKLAADAASREAEQTREAAKRVQQQEEQLANKRIEAAKAGRAKAAEQAAKDQAAAVKRLEDLRIQAIQDGQERELAALKLRTEREVEALKGTEAQIAEQKRLIEEAAQQAAQDVRDKYAEERRKQQEQEGKDAIANMQAQHNREMAELERQQQEAALAATQKLVSDIEGGADPAEAEEAFKAELLRIEEAFLQGKLDLQTTYGVDTLETQQAIEDARLAQTQSRVDAELQAEQAKFQQSQQQAQQFLGGVQEASGLLFDALGVGLQNQVTELEAEKAKALEGAGDNAEKRAQIEEKFQKKLDAIDLKRRKQEKARAIVQSIIATALAVTKALPNPVAAVAAGVTGAAQTALIAAQKLADGGFTGAGVMGADETGERPAGIVHANEWVAPRWMTESPRYAPMIGMLERARVQGYAEGGPVAGPSAEAQTAVQADSRQMSQMIYDAMGAAIRENPFSTLVTEKDVDDITEVQNDISSRRGRRGM